MKLKPPLLATATLVLAIAICSIGTPKSPDPCDEAFQALTAAFKGTRPGVVEDGVINVWPANSDGSASHPRVNWGAKSNSSWRNVASFMRFNCPEYDVESLAVDKDERFYDDGVIVRRKPARDFSLQSSLSKELSGGVMATIAAITAFLGIGTLGLGTKKTFA